MKVCHGEDIALIGENGDDHDDDDDEEEIKAKGVPLLVELFQKTIPHILSSLAFYWRR